MFEGKPDRYITCWMCVMKEFFKALDSKQVQCICSEKDVPKILIFKDQFGVWQFRIIESNEVD